MLSAIRNTPLEYVSVALTMRGSSYAYIDTIRYLGSVSAVIAICLVVRKKLPLERNYSIYTRIPDKSSAVSLSISSKSSAKEFSDPVGLRAILVNFK